MPSNSVPFRTIVRPVVDAHRKHLIGEASDAREGLALVDVLVRAVYVLTHADALASGSPPRLHKHPGLGTMLSVVTATAQAEAETSEPWHRARVRALCSEVLEAVASFKPGGGYNSLTQVRNRLSHGGTLPTDEATARALAESVCAVCDRLEEVFLQRIGDCSVDPADDTFSLIPATGGQPLALAPFWVWFGTSPKSALYSHVARGELYYLVPGEQVQTASTLGSSNGRVEDFIRQHREDWTELKPFVQDTIQDITAFTEDSSPPSYFFGDDADRGVLVVPWTRATSDENQPRLDRFRIGPNNEHQWHNSEEGRWRGYTDFLRAVSNWPLLAKRIGIGLAKFQDEREREESTRLGSGEASRVAGPARLRETTLDLEARGPADFDLVARTDDACDTLKPSTSVFFLVGQAGLGKTQFMLTKAIDRAGDIAEGRSAGPLYLFVSSTGRTLASLEDCVDAALNLTKLLTAQGARTLCRRGLLVLFVDGFDELLGSSGYQNALGSLEPWFRELGGRGVLVASARSSYYLTQYRRSLNETTGINVDHTTVRLEPWEKEDVRVYLEAHGTDPRHLTALQPRDWSILSVPFFAKAFAAWHATDQGGQGGTQPIFEIVVDQYLSRESNKLVDSNQRPLLSPDELRELFTEIAEMMHRDGVRELEHTDLVSCAQLVLEAESLEHARRGLSQRLTSLCGLGAGSHTGGTQSTFSFAHEVMYDCFLTLALLRAATGSAGAADAMKPFFAAAKIQRTVMDWLVERSTPVTREKLIELVSHPSLASSETLAHNGGLLWTSLLDWQEGLPPTDNVHGLRLGAVELAGTERSTLRLSSCHVESLGIPITGNVSIVLSECSIGLLEGERASLRRSITGLVAARVQQIQTPEGYENTPQGVRRTLESLGLVQPEPDPAAQDRVDAAAFFLERLGQGFTVVARTVDKIPDDPRLAWTQRLGEEEWLGFVNALVTHGLASWVPFAASGQPKSRLSFDVSQAAIVARDGQDARIPAFWQAIADG